MSKRTTKRTASKARDRVAVVPGAFGVGLENLIGYNLRRAHGLQKQRFATVFAPYSIRPVSLSALGTIFDHRRITQTELGKKLNVKRANIVPLLAELEGRGLIMRRKSRDDRRSQVVSLTAAGQKFTMEMLELHRRLEEDLVRNLGLRERDHLLQLLKKFRRVTPEPDVSETD
jgi:DNA-binding MarR family transcriptional regulator